MKPRNLFNKDDRGVSPVIGVILMVAITVILAAVIGTFVLGLGDSLGDSQPTAQISAEITDVDTTADTANITLEHAGGDRIDSGALRVIVSDSSGNQAEASGEFADAFTVGDVQSGEFDITSGTSGDIRIRIIHSPSDSILLDQTVEEDEFDAVSGDITFN